MALVGSILISAREVVPDLPATLSAPSGYTVAQVTATCTLPAGTYYAKLTALNNFGETVATSESTGIVVDASHGLGFTFSSLPVGATKLRMYFGIGSGNETQYVETSTSPLNALAPGSPGTPPSRSTAWLPDSDGSLVSGATAYRWLNESLEVAARITGGILDETGVATSTNAPIYALTGQWLKFTHGWYDGWPIGFGGAQDAFQKTRVTGITATVNTFKQNDTQYIEGWPIPNRTASTSSLTGGVAATDTSLPYDTTNPLNLDHGLVLIDSEILYFGAASGSNLVSCVRGLGGTTAAAHSNAAVITELNLRLRGYRMPSTYSVGDSLKTLSVPAAWPSLLVTYLISKFREAEQDYQLASQLRQQFTQEMQLWAKSNKPLAGPKQMGGRLAAAETVPGLGSIGGGIIRL